MRPTLFVLLLTSTLHAGADQLARLDAAIPAGSVVAGAAGPNQLVLATEGARTLVLRAGEARWVETATLLDPASGARIATPTPHAYRAVLVPVYAEAGRVILGFDVFAVTSVVTDASGQRMIIAGNGRGYAIGPDAAQPNVLRENIPVQSGQSIPEAIRAFNATAGAAGSTRVISETPRLDRSREFEVIDLARERARADGAATAGPADKRAERAVRAEHGLVERARLRDAILKAQRAR